MSNKERDIVSTCNMKQTENLIPKDTKILL